MIKSFQFLILYDSPFSSRSSEFKISNNYNGEEYDFLKTLPFERAQKTTENPTNHTPI